MGPQRRNAPRGISFHRHSAKSEKLGLSGSNGDGHPTSALPSAATRVGATAKAPSDIVEPWTMHARNSSALGARLNDIRLGAEGDLGVGDYFRPYCFVRARLRACRHKYVNSLPAALRLRDGGCHPI
jgi:hypothetical protein